MFEEPEWASAALVAAGLGPVISRPPPTAALQNKVSDPQRRWELFQAAKQTLVDPSAVCIAGRDTCGTVEGES